MTPGFCRFMLTKVLGWTIDDKMEIEEKTAIFLAAPHTSIWDFAIGYFYARANRQHLKVMIKKEAFFWPVNWLLRSMGGFPVDRSNASALILSLIKEMKETEGTFYLAICPEGTRKAVKKWKTGYHLIASQVGCPVYLAYYDWKTKHVGCGSKFTLTDDARGDTDRIQEAYARMNLTGKYPEDYTA